MSGDAVTTARSIESATGRITAIDRDNTDWILLQQGRTYWDLLENVSRRAWQVGDVSFDEYLSYDALGNITKKGGVGDYTYGSARPHAVTRAGNLNYTYDANGNVTAEARTGERARYLLTDHLGSLSRIIDEAGSVLQSFRFDAWGQRRNPDDAGVLAQLTLTSPLHTRLTARGFTGHEMLDAAGIVHMNGRIYDPTLGRFLQPDPVIQFPDYTQGRNRYSYVLNNPLTHTDPTGYFIGKLFKKVFKGLNRALGDVAPFLSIALLALPGMPGLVFNSWAGAAGFGFITGGIATGSLKGALFGGVSAAAFYGIGEHFTAVTGLAEGGLGHVLTHGITGGILAELQGGQFGHGFLAAGLSKAVLGRFSYRDGSAPAVLGRTTIAAIVGGTVSRVTGGKFANGALTAAMAQLFNNELSNKRKQADNERTRQVGEVHGRGDSLVFEGGKEIKVEPYSHTQGVDSFTYEVDYRFLDSEGNMVPMVIPLDIYGNPRPAYQEFVTTGFGGGGPDQIFNASSRYHDRVQWRISIPRQPATSGNSAGWTLRVYEVE
ncbi:MAG: hypothetical protein F4147_00660 [Gammaproteobacteria bacterium]|nr:hypothetical protein [Gammaproteobacteria bacterium]